jgi:D-apionolactonase
MPMVHYLQAGPVQVRYKNGFLRYLSIDDVEIVRMIYFALRNEDWLTAKTKITDEQIAQTDDTFSIRYNWQTDDLGIQMAGTMHIAGDANGTISVDFQGEAQNSFLKNRVGLCVLHPLDGVMGQPCQILNTDGQQTDGRFPEYISPYQPFFAIQTIRWQPASGHDVQLTFRGEVFEMEDQRNWTDASFKTYSTPLRLPFPAQMAVGDTVAHQLEFRIVAQNMAANQPAGSAQTDATVPAHRPRIGLGQRADGQSLTDSEAIQLRRLPLAHLRADVFFSTNDWQIRLTNALADARLLNVQLELALFFGDKPAEELAVLGKFLAPVLLVIGSVLLFDAATLLTSDALLRQVIPTIRTTWPAVLIGGGTDGNFAEFNRNPFDYRQVDFVTYSINPQVHAFDDLTLLENIEGQAHTVHTAKHLTGNKPVHISPITLLPRYTTVANSATERLNPAVDHRQATAFCADWTRRSIQALTLAGVWSVTYYETHGPRGLMNWGEVLLVRDGFRS